MGRTLDSAASRPDSAGEENAPPVGEDVIRRRPLVVGVAGGSGSGKTTVVRRLLEGL